MKFELSQNEKFALILHYLDVLHNRIKSYTDGSYPYKLDFQHREDYLATIKRVGDLIETLKIVDGVKI